MSKHKLRKAISRLENMLKAFAIIYKDDPLVYALIEGVVVDVERACHDHYQPATEPKIH